MTFARTFLARSSLVGIAGLSLGLTGCHMEQRYLTPEGGTVFQLGMAPDTPALVMTEEAALYSVEMDVPFPIRPPTDAEMAALEGEAVAPFERAPWVRRGDYEVTIELTVTNLETERVTASATINGMNEFTRYVPGFTVDEEAVIVDFSQWEHTWSLRPGERVSITVREEQLDEAAVDLASVINGDACSAIANEIVYFQNQSASDPRSQMCMPAMIPALDGVVLGLRTESVVTGTDAMGMETTRPAGLALEASVRIRDVRDRIQGAGQPEWELPVPVPFTPPIIEMP
jgi:hypothetical protein